MYAIKTKATGHLSPKHWKSKADADEALADLFAKWPDLVGKAEVVKV